MSARPAPGARIASAFAGRLLGQGPGEWIAPVLARALPGAGLVLLCALVAAGLGLAAPMVTKALIDQGIMARDMGALLHWAAVSFAVGLGSVGLGMVSGMLHLRASARMLADLRGVVLGAALARDPLLPDLPLGESVARIDGDSAEIQRFAFDSVLVAVNAVFRLAGGTVLMLLLDWRLALLPVLAAPVELAFLSWARDGTNSRAEEAREMRGVLGSHMTESLATLGALRAFGAGGRRRAAFDGMQTQQVGVLARQRMWSEMVGAVSQMISALTRSAVLLVGGWLVIRGDWPIGTLVAFLAYATMMSGPLRNLLGLYHAQAKARVALDRLSGVIGAAAPLEAGASCPLRPQELDFEDAAAPDGGHAPVSCTLRAGERVLIDGPSGIGKSRLMALLNGGAPRAGGHVRIDGRDAAEMSLASRALAITHLAQRPVILRGTLAENLRLGAPEAPDVALWNALAVADLADWAAARGGLDTALGETGSALSGGLRQRIALARALLRPSGVFIFDESFSEIDAAACRRILTRIDAAYGERLRIFIAHAGPAREGAFTQTIVLSEAAPLRRNSLGDMPYQRAKARENAV